MTFSLTTRKLNQIAKGENYPFSTIDLERLAISRRALLQYLESEERSLIYGIDTGFGPHAFQNNEDRLENQLSLVYHLSVASDKHSLRHEEARAVLAARIHSLCQGGSGISTNTLALLSELLRLDCIPLIPERGSLSASGDLIPLAAIALALIGESEWTGKNKSFGPTLKNGKTSKIEGLPLELAPKEALSLTNGTSFTTALLSLQVELSSHLLSHTIEFLKILFRFHAVYADAFLPALHETKLHKGPVLIAKELYSIAKANSKSKQPGERVQDIYSIRCLPHILGSIMDEIISIRETVENELNSLSDNPVFIESENRYVEGGNFYASHVSFAADRLQNSLAVLATWSERFIQYLYTPSENKEFNLMLSPEPGKYAGLSGLGLLATHLTAEIRRDSMPGSVQSLSSNGGNQDIVPMGAISVLRNRRTLDSLTSILSILGYSIFQAGHLKGIDLSTHQAFVGVRGLDVDRSLKEELKTIEKNLGI
ncbi:aromatic amino acid lyase [Leptospira ognonensis]|uniref:Aromatic amino acid lyase n=1 Tax=Leptospira ognonensis TaxID=2484945 RepID=A0A4R9KDD0_9LEPT|nr:aromatic amino acid lyase [Leptospira ognonensis]TGL63945.1 aromatic amino acid lyase [Leptospira ognonensis]